MESLVDSYSAKSTLASNEQAADGLDEDVAVVVKPEPAGGDDQTVSKNKRKSSKKKSGQKKNTNTKSTKRSSSSEVEDFPALFSDMGDWLKHIARPVTELDSALRILLLTLFLGGAYMINILGLQFFTNESTQIEKLWGFAVCAFGGIPALAILFFIGIQANGVIRVAIEERGSLSEWPDFSLADWVSQFIFLATSFWLAAFPGLILGGVAALVFNLSFLFYASIIISSLMFAPLVLPSVVYHESPWAMISSDILVSVKELKFRWIRYWIFTFLISLLLISTLVFFAIRIAMLGFVAAGIQVTLLFIYYWLLGQLVGSVVRFMTERDN